MRKVFGIGVNDSTTSTQRFVVSKDENGKKKNKLVWICPYYRKWKDMLKRCYYQTDFISYKDCYVTESWLLFSNFRDWCILQEEDYSFEVKDLHLDKDLLKKGNKEYSPSTCVFVDSKVNTFILDSKKARGSCMLGVNLNKTKTKYEAWCRSYKSRKQTYLGVYPTEIEAHLAWKYKKHELSCELAESIYVFDDRIREVLRNRYRTEL